ncbi:hypothetical protein FQZ97_1065820 [compost metagenome]
MMCFFIRIGCNDVESQHHIRLLQIFGRLKTFAIKVYGAFHVSWRKMRGEAIRQTQHRSQLRAKQA